MIIQWIVSVMNHASTCGSASHTHTHTHTRECLVNLKKYLYSQRIEQTKDVLEYEIEM